MKIHNIYDKQDDLKSSEKDIIDFLNCDKDTKPYEELKRRRDKVPKKLFENMEGKLTDYELHSALFEHMNGSSSPEWMASLLIISESSGLIGKI